VTAEEVAAFADCIGAGGVAVFPADTVYGVACDPDSDAALRRLYELKGRPPGKPAAVMFFALDRALEALPDIGPRTGAALRRLLPGGVTVLLANRGGRFAAACGADPATLGVRVPDLPEALASLATVTVPVAQSSANLAGEPPPRRLADVPREIRTGADLELEGGELPGTASTVLDLRDYEREGRWHVERAGAVAESALAAALD